MNRNIRSQLAPLAAIALLALYAGQPPALAAQSTRNSIPARLSDSAFWALSSNLSEAGGSFHSENFVSNEGLMQRLIPALQERVGQRGIYLGVGPEQNFTYIAALKPRMAFIMDIRRQAVVQHLMYKALFELSPTRAEFLGRLFSRPAPKALGVNAKIVDLLDSLSLSAGSSDLFDRNYKEVTAQLAVKHKFPLTYADSNTLSHLLVTFYTRGPTISYSTGPAGSPGSYVGFYHTMVTPDDAGVNRSFLATEANYAFVRDMHLANLIVPVVGDFAGNKALRAIGSYVREHGATISAYYVSNVEEYLFARQETWTRFYANVESLPLDTTSIFIRPQTGVTLRQLQQRDAAMRGAPNQQPPAASLSGRTVTVDGMRVIVGSEPQMQYAQPSQSFAGMLRTLAAVKDGTIMRHSDIFRIR